ncbi:MAG TPA: hypothetical protein VGY58_17335, partial [Gemmataceae bacterium]|nr:hypothetical protein [Gemmataceae bacterium]
MAKINLKDFDFKQFFLRYGEWVGLAIAALIMLPAFAMGVMNFVTAGSAHTNAEALASVASSAERRIRESNPPPGTDEAPKESTMQVRNDRVVPENYVPPEEWFIPSSIEDTKRRAPVVLAPGDFQLTVLRGGMMSHIFTTLPDGKVQVLVIREKQTPLSPRQKRDKERYE